MLLLFGEYRRIQTIQESCNLNGWGHLDLRNSEAEFSKIFGLHRKTENWKVFHFRLLPATINDKILWKLKKNPFWALVVHFRANKNCSGKSTSVIFLFLEFYSCEKFQKKTKTTLLLDPRIPESITWDYVCNEEKILLFS